MRRLVSSIFITLDGVVESPHSWNPPYFEERMTAAVQAGLGASDTHLYGRRSYEMFRSVFTGPQARKIPHAGLMNETPKVLVSSMIDDPDWGPTMLIDGDIAGEIRRLKELPGSDISVQASGTLLRLLLANRLLDELHLLVHPVVVGKGRRLFEDGAGPAELELEDTDRFPSGVVSMRLVPQTNPQAPSLADDWA